MRQTLAKILAVHNGNTYEAIAYCVRMSERYPKLKDEYLLYVDLFRTGEHYENSNPLFRCSQ